MAQFHWTYVSDAGKHHNVGLYHGQSSGHLLAHCNGSVVLVDFNVRESKTYPLFIDDELFDLKLDRRDDRFVYTFEINKEADTPRNRRRRQRDRRHLRQSLILVAGFVGLLLIAILTIRSTHPRPIDPPRQAALAQYRQMAIDRHLALHPELSAAYVGCLVDAGYQALGAEAYAAFYLQSPPGVDNPAHIEARLDQIIAHAVDCPQR